MGGGEHLFWTLQKTPRSSKLTNLFTFAQNAFPKLLFFFLVAHLFTCHEVMYHGTQFGKWWTRYLPSVCELYNHNS